MTEREKRDTIAEELVKASEKLRALGMPLRDVA